MKIVFVCCCNKNRYPNWKWNRIFSRDSGSNTMHTGGTNTRLNIKTILSFSRRNKNKDRMNLLHPYTKWLFALFKNTIYLIITPLQLYKRAIPNFIKLGVHIFDYLLKSLSPYGLSNFKDAIIQKLFLFPISLLVKCNA